MRFEKKSGRNAEMIFAGIRVNRNFYELTDSGLEYQSFPRLNSSTRAMRLSSSVSVMQILP